MRAHLRHSLILAIGWDLWGQEHSPVKTVDASELRRMVRRAATISIKDRSGLYLTGKALEIETQGKIVLIDTAGARTVAGCESIFEIEVKSVRRSVLSHVAVTIVVAGGGAFSIAAGVAVHPAFFAGIPAAILAGRKIEKRSKRTKSLVVTPRCSTFP